MTTQRRKPTARAVAAVTVAAAVVGLVAFLPSDAGPSSLLPDATDYATAPSPSDSMRAMAESYLFRGVDGTTGEKASAQAVGGEVRGDLPSGEGLAFGAYSDMRLFAAQLGVALDGDLRAHALQTNGDLEALVAFVNGLHLEESTVVVLALAQHTQRFVASEPRFHAEVDVGAEGEKDFVGRYGDAYIAAATVGSAYVGTLVCRNVTKGEEGFLAAKLEVAVAERMRVDPTAAARGLARVERQFRCNCAIHEASLGSASGDAHSASGSAAQIAARALKYSGGHVTQPALLAVQTAPYADVEDMPLPKALDTIVDNRAYASLAGGLLEGLAARRAQLVRIYQAYDVYGYPAGDGSLERVWEAVSSVDNATAAVRVWQRAFQANVATRHPRADTDRLLHGDPPEPCVTAGYSGVAGNQPAPKAFDDAALLAASKGGATIGSAVLRQARLSAVEVRSGSNVVGIQRFWSDTSEEGSFTSEADGGHSGKKTKIDFAGEPLTAARFGVGTEGKLVSVELTLGADRRVIFGNPAAADRKAWFDPPPGGHAVPMGFAGFFDDDPRAGYVARLQMVYAVFHPFYWDAKRCQRDG